MVAAAVETRLATVPRLWPGSTVVCVAPGPSLTAEDCARIRGQHVIAINSAVTAVPWAEVLYSSDQYWFPKHKGVPTFAGLKFALQPYRDRIERNPFAAWPDIQVIANTGEEGLELSPDGLRHGKNSGYAAINLAVHLGAWRVLLLGYDMGLGSSGEAHFDGTRKDSGNDIYRTFAPRFESLKRPLAQAGVTVLNCSRRTALHTFPRVPLEQAL